MGDFTKVSLQGEASTSYELTIPPDRPTILRISRPLNRESTLRGYKSISPKHTGSVRIYRMRWSSLTTAEANELEVFYQNTKLISFTYENRRYHFVGGFTRVRKDIGVYNCEATVEELKIP